MSTPTVITTGVSGGEVSPRLEINDFVKDEKHFSLLVQALGRMTADDQASLTSHFQIAGIHGLPYVQYDDAGGTKPINPPKNPHVVNPFAPDPWDGYCVHGSTLFPTWHRPYVALYEQIIQGYAIQIADTYTTPDKADWQQAAKTLRLPHWDWTLKATQGVPPDQVLTMAKVNITGPDGSQQSVDNPLYSYKFHPIDQSFEDDFATWPATLRCPSSTDPDATSQPDVATTNISSTYEQRNSAIINLLSNVDSWLDMSNHTQRINPNYQASLESIHDQMHVNIGGRDISGHMSDPDYAGMDPVFFFHHAHVDYLMSMWQAMHTDAWIETSTAQGGGTWTLVINQDIDSTTDLTPFWKSDTTFWNSDEVRSPDPFHYNYPALANLDKSTPDAARTELSKRIAQLYDVNRAFPHLINAPAQPGRQQPIGSGHEARDWRVHVEVVKYALGGSFSIYIFIGEVPESTSQWISSPSFVGTHDVFARKSPFTCANCTKELNRIDEGVVYLGPALHRANLSSYEPDIVEPYLRQNLQWRVTKAGKGIIPNEELESLKVSVISVPMRLDHLPRQVGAVQRHPTITQGRAGGAADAA